MTTTSAVNVSQPKKNYVARGALIGAGFEVASRIGINACLIKNQGYDTFVKNIDKIGKGKYAAICALGVAAMAGFGALVGKIVEACKNKKAENTQEA